jgi:Transglutaminase-like superfamily
VGQRVFRIAWRVTNVALVAAVVALLFSAGWEYSVRRYLDGFADAVIPRGAAPEQRVQAILDWMRKGPPRLDEPNPTGLAIRDPENTLNYQQLLSVCGTATNAFLNLARSSHLQVRRLLLLTPDRNTKHVVAEVLLDERWIIVDPTYRVILRDDKGEMLTRSDLKDQKTFAQATSKIPDYPTEYNYNQFAHVRVARLPLEGLHLRALLDGIYPGWDELADWSLLLERESFFMMTMAACMTLLLLLFRTFMAWFADHRLQVPRFHLRDHLVRACAAFVTSPAEIK